MIRRYNRFWTEEDDHLLLELQAAGRSSVFIGAALKRSAQAIDKRSFTLKARAETSNANDDKSPLIDLITCIVCKVTTKIAYSAPDPEGSDLVQYRCELCNRTERVLLFRRSRDGP
jgi:hypothetical protein